jgi:dTDP-4-amino-4,6-dideoxygalactose transaminase
VIEDSCEAIGAEAFGKGRNIRRGGLLCVLSNKQMTTGEGG